MNVSNRSSLLWRKNHRLCHPLFDRVRVAGMYNCAQSERSWSVQPLARTAWRTLFTLLGRENTSARKRWSHKSYWGSIHRYPF
jgi:hypothetical protein